MDKLIVIIGVTGAQGGSVARTFAQLPDWRVRGITRNSSSPAAKKLQEIGVQIVQGDADDKQSLIDAFVGAHVIFSNADYFAHLFHVLNPANLPEGQSSWQYALRREIEQAINIAEAAETPSVLKTLERFVFSSLVSAKKWSKEKYTKAYHQEGKEEAPRLSWNLRQQLEILVNNEYMSFTDFMELWGQHHGVKAGYREISTAEMVKDMPEVMATDLGQAYDFSHEFGFTGGDPEVLELEQIPVKVEVTSMADYIKTEDWSQIINAK
ncbi:putative hscarg dehydrogenase [Planoprotostelium fungivorum]|uniref:Putative hscarg dehydrogenase n=1 Tax=Planoprotostelium fungivorum TaxID=1890364 RepID=A0A2P6NCX4_9EUKA|nr:putative hscarg dehydrogenase [Planoprotostelium fungivorum]